jgi:hypothetical protein
MSSHGTLSHGVINAAFHVSSAICVIHDTCVPSHFGANRVLVGGGSFFCRVNVARLKFLKVALPDRSGVLQGIATATGPSVPVGSD